MIQAFAVVATISVIAGTVALVVAGTIMSGGAGAVAIPAVVALASVMLETCVAAAAIGISTALVGAAGENISNFSSERIFNSSKQNSKIFDSFDRVKGKSYRTSGKGRNKRYYDWDYTHNDIEVYDSLGRHLGAMNPLTGEMYKGAVAGKTL